MSHPIRIACYLAFGTFGLCASSPLYADSLTSEEREKLSSLSRFDTITVNGNLLYSMPSSEQTGGYSVDSAFVGTKAPAALRDIPQSVNVVTSRVIHDQNVHTLDEVARNTPGMRILANDAGRSSIYSRGYEYDSFEINGLSAPMSSMLGTVPQLAAFDRVEIMSGPSGLFDSASEMGGIVNLQLKRPTHEFQGSVTGSYGLRNQRYFESDLSGPINPSKTLRGRMVIANDHPDAYVKHSHSDINTFYGTLSYDLTRKTTLDLSFLRQNMNMVPNNGVAADKSGNLVNYPRSTRFGSRWDYFRNQSNDWIAEISHQFDSGGYAHAGLRSSHRDVTFDYIYGGGKGLLNDRQIVVAGLGQHTRQQSLSFDASFSQPFSVLGHVSEFVIGTDYKRYSTYTDQANSRNIHGNTVDYRNFDKLQYVNLLGVARGTSVLPAEYHGRVSRSHYHTELEDYGLYSKLTFRPFSSLALIGGMRLSGYDEKNQNYMRNGSELRRKDHGKVTPYGGLVLDIDDHHSLYASYSQVFNPQTNRDVKGGMIKARQGEQYEAGIKGAYHDGQLNARISTFKIYDKNRAAAIINNPGHFTAIGKSRMQGAEFEVSGRVANNLNMVAGYTYLDTKILKASVGNRDAIFQLMPRHVGNLWADYRFCDQGWDKLSLGGGMNVLSDVQFSRKTSAPGFAIFNAMLAYDFTSKLKGQVNLNNILDRKYYERISGFATFNMYGAPRSGVASLTYQL